MEAFIAGLPRSIEGNVTASKPQTLEEAINIAQRLMDQIIKHNSMLETNDRKRKLEDKGNIINNNYQNNYNKKNCNNDHHQQQNRKQETFRTYTATNGYTGNLPLCKKYRLHHTGPCSVKCQGVGAEVEYLEPGFELQGAKMVEKVVSGSISTRTPCILFPGLQIFKDLLE
ncbi:hypothetical protein Tco_0195194 [Tanacetum coccineum]